MTETEQQLLERFDWLTADDLQLLRKKPWLAVFIEADDDSLIPARTRHRRAVSAARVELRKRGKEPHRRMMAGKTIETTAYVDPITEEG